MLNPQSIVARRPGIIHTKLANHEAVLLDLEARRYFSLNLTGAEIWEYLEEEATVSAISEKLVGRYEVELDQATESVKSLLADLLKERLITAHD